MTIQSLYCTTISIWDENIHWYRTINFSIPTIPLPQPFGFFPPFSSPLIIITTNGNIIEFMPAIFMARGLKVNVLSLYCVVNNKPLYYNPQFHDQDTSLHLCIGVPWFQGDTALKLHRMLRYIRGKVAYDYDGRRARR